MDRRRRQWLPLSAEFPFDATGTRLQAELGPGALAVWVAYLTACRRNGIPGQITYTSDAECWANLGFHEPDPFGWPVDNFWELTGQLKKTRRRRRGRITDVINTRWEDWQQTIKRDLEQQRKARSRHKNRRDIRENLGGLYAVDATPYLLPDTYYLNNGQQTVDNSAEECEHEVWAITTDRVPICVGCLEERPGDNNDAG